jgi:hypothetical protein
MEWLFLTCHNSWVVFRLVSRDLDNGEPFLVYSPSYTIRDTSEPFRAFLGAIFSAKWEVSVQASILQPYTDLSVILKEVDEGPLPEDDIDDGSGGYRDHSRMVVLPRVPMTRSCVHSAGPGLMVCPVPGISSQLVHDIICRLLPLHHTFLNHSKCGYMLSHY